MENTTKGGSGESLNEPRRCANCDSVISAEYSACLMCGAPVPNLEPQQPAAQESRQPPEPTLPGSEELGQVKPSEVGRPNETSPAHLERAARSAPGQNETRESNTDVFESRLVERQSRAVLWMAGVTFVITAIVGSIVLQRDQPVQLALMPTATPPPPTFTLTPTVTAQAGAGAATQTPTTTPMPSATVTPQAPRTHRVTEGETLFGLAYVYDVSMDVIAELNDFPVEAPIQSGQSLQIPWPTATPPLEPVEVLINGESVIADPTDCERYEIQEGDALSVIAARNNINFELLLRVNRLTDQSIMQPGDTICIPRVVYGEILPPTPGPSPTASATSFPPGPVLLYPTDGAVIDMVEEPIVLQWLAVKDLAPDEWYMVELTDTDVVDRHPQRAFTRDNAFRVPHSWRPHVEDYHRFRWRISIVRVTGQRDDGGFIYTFGGRFSEQGTFTWRGAIPTVTPTSTTSPTPIS